MPMDRFLIAPFDDASGLNTSMRPWQIPDSAWARMDNAYIFRGRVKKRFGSRYMGSNSSNTTIDPLTSRLRFQVGTIGSPTSPVLGSIFQAGQAFSAGTQIFTVISNTPGAQAMLVTGPGTGTFNVSNGNFVLSGTGLGGSTPIYFYPGLPVMGLLQYEFTPINNYTSFGFDQQFAYIYNNGWSLSNGSPIWHGTDINFFWGWNYIAANVGETALVNALFVTNFYAVNPNGSGNANDDPIYYWNNTTWTAYYAYINPGIGNDPDTGPFVLTSRMVIGFHGRLILLNTIENDGSGGIGAGVNTNYVNRMRYSNLNSAFAVNAFYPQGAADNAGNIGATAGYRDAWTAEAVISAEFIKDRLIVYFEESTWEILYTGNEQNPLEWQKLNTELGSMATFSTIAFDKAVLTVGEVGIHSCNGVNVVRIDDKIPDQIFMLSNQMSEVQRICGIRDYYSEMVYWSVPEAGLPSNQPYPTRILVYNYQNKTWAFNDDVITTYGYFDGQVGQTWATLKVTWEQWNQQWNSGSVQTQVRQVIGGNQQGYTFVIDTDVSRNEAVMQITAMVLLTNGIQLTIYNHMLQDGQFIYIQGQEGVVIAGFGIYEVQLMDQNNVRAFYPSDIVRSTNPQTLPTFTGTYTGGGVVGRVSNYNLYSKQWNPYDSKGRNVYVSKIDFSVNNTGTPQGNALGGQVTIDYSPSSTELSVINSNGVPLASIMGTSVLETAPYPVNLYSLEQEQQRLWHPIYLQVDGECIQINIYMNDLQVCTPTCTFTDLEIHGLVLHTKPVSDRLQ